MHKEFYANLVDEITGTVIDGETKRVLLDEVLIDAIKLTSLPDEMSYIKEMYRSRLINAYTSTDVGDDEIEAFVRDYSDIRFNSLRLNTKFMEAVRGPHATYYLRILREQIADELELSKEATQFKELEWEKFQVDNFMEYDAESIYNLQHLSNTEAVGLNNLEQRALSPEKNRELAHETMFDKLLAEYFLQKRQQIVNVNDLIDKLGQKLGQDTFNNFLNVKDSDPHYTRDAFQLNQYSEHLIEHNGKYPISFAR